GPISATGDAPGSGRLLFAWTVQDRPGWRRRRETLFRFAFLLGARVQQRLLELADRSVGMREADDAVDVAGGPRLLGERRDPNSAGTDVADDDGAALGRQFAGIAA